MTSKIYYWAFEGNEGTGKTSISKKFAEACNASWTYEPNGETSDLKTLRTLALNENKDMTVQGRESILLANRSIHQNVHVYPLLQNYGTVVTDRSFLSGMVYAKLNGISFKSFMDMMRYREITLYPDAIIYCTSNKRKISKNKYDIYDNASEETLIKIDSIFEEALSYLEKDAHTKKIKIIRFKNNLTVPAEDNLERLLTLIKETIQE